VSVCAIVARMSKRGPKLTYSSSGTPTCEVLLEVDEVGKGRQVFTCYLPVEISGKFAEMAAAELKAGMKFRSLGS